MAKALTVKAIESFNPKAGKRQHIPDGGMPGLYFIIQPSGAKSWAVWYRRGGKQSKFTIGAYPAFGLKDAREAAGAALRLVSEGGDPVAQRNRTKADAHRDLFYQVMGDFLARHIRPKSRPSYAAETERMLRKDVLPKWGNRRIGDITKRDVIELLDGITDAGRGLTANRTFAAVRKLFNWAIERDILDASPCQGVKPPAQETARDRVLRDDELRAVWSATDEIGYPFGGLVRLLILTGQRRSEVAGMTYDEIKDGVWTIPAARSKNSKPHDVPLSDLALATIEALPAVRCGRDVPPYLFTTNGLTHVTGYSRAKSRLEKLVIAELEREVTKNGEPVAEIPRWTLHDLRRTIATGLQRLGFNLQVIEAVLGHVSGSRAGVVGIYQRHSFDKEKRVALDRWALHVEELVSGEPSKVITFPGTAS